jgi:hypothetical protein
MVANHGASSLEEDVFADSEMKLVDSLDDVDLLNDVDPLNDVKEVTEPEPGHVLIELADDHSARCRPPAVDN